MCYDYFILFLRVSNLIVTAQENKFEKYDTIYFIPLLMH